MTEPIIKKRKIAVVGIKSQEDADKIKDFLKKKEGVITAEVDIKKGSLKIKYDLEKTTFETIEKSIKETGFELSKKIKEKFKRGMAKFTEQNELDNLAAKPASCCEDPKNKNPKNKK